MLADISKRPIYYSYHQHKNRNRTTLSFDEYYDKFKDAETVAYNPTTMELYATTVAHIRRHDSGWADRDYPRNIYPDRRRGTVGFQLMENGKRYTGSLKDWDIADAVAACNQCIIDNNLDYPLITPEQL